jgi:tyrosine-protein kinase Etk/Wzc
MSKGNDSAFFEEFLNHSDSLDFQKVFKVIRSRWYWLAGSLLVFGSLCFLYLKLIKPEYVATTELIFSERQSELDELSSAKPAFLLNNGNNDYLTEKYNVRAQEVVENALVKLNNPFTFYRLKDFRQIDLYPVKPLQLQVLDFDPIRFEYGTFLIDKTRQISYESTNCKETKALIKGSIFTIPGLSFLIEEIQIPDAYEFKFVFNDPSKRARDLIKYIEVKEVEEEMPVLTLSFKHHNRPFAKDFLEKLLESYQQYDLKQKQRSSDLTLRFIGEQVKVYAATLKDAARALEIFKQKNTVLDIGASAAEISEKSRNLELRRNESEIQKAYISMLETNLGTTFEPVNYLSVGLDGTTDAVLVGLLEQFNTLVSKRKEWLIKYSMHAASVKNLDEELGRCRRQILDNILLQKHKNTAVTKILDAQIQSLQKRFNQIPALEKNYVYLHSNFEINKNIYSLLLNKKIESSIVRAGILPSFKIITLMEVDKVLPKPVQSITLSIFLGTLAGLSTIFLVRYFNTKFVRIDLIDSSAGIGYLGTVHHLDAKTGPTDILELSKPGTTQTRFTESISSLRTRISFLKYDGNLHPEKGKQILVTSEMAGEGKTFISVNLALSLTKIGKKVIVISCDLRKSKLHHFFNDINEDGLSNYLQNPGANSPIRSSQIPNLDYIAAGPPPFNPAELLQRNPFQDLLSFCRGQYDYVILDTAPVGLVSDNVPLLANSHMVAFVLRWLYSDQDAYKLAAQLAKAYEISKIQVIVNDYYPDALYDPITSTSQNDRSYSQDRYDYAYLNDDLKQEGTLKKIKNRLSVIHK